MWQDVARRQGGVIRRGQLRATGLTDRQIDAVVRRGHLRRAGPAGTFTVNGAPWTPDTALWTAALTTRGVVSHQSAARCWGLPVPEDVGVHVTVDRRVRTAAAHGIVIHRLPLTGKAVTELHGLPVTTRPRTVLDCIGSLAPTPARLLLDRSLQVHAVSARDLERRLTNEPGRFGNRQIGRLYRELTGAAAESERVLHGLLRAADLDGWTPNLWVEVDGAMYEIDVAFVEARLAIEVDGWAHHVEVSRFRADRRKQNALTLAGWVTIRFTWADLVEQPERVVSTIRRRLARDRGRFATPEVED